MAMPTGFSDRMQVDDAASDRSSSDISSPPISPQNNGFSDTINVSRPQLSNPQLLGGGVAAAPSATPAQAAFATNAAAHAPNGNTSSSAAANANSAAPEKKKRVRKKKEVGPDGKPVDDGPPKEKKPRKPREPSPKDANGNPITAPRKRQKTEDKSAHDVSASSRQPTIHEMVGPFQPPQPPKAIPMPPRPQHSNSESIIRSRLTAPTSNPATPRPISSGQNYDPITGQMRPSNPPVQTTSAHASPHLARASASPSIASLIDPPMITRTTSMNIHSPHATMQQPFVPSQPHSPTPGQLYPASFAAPPAQASPPPPIPPQIKRSSVAQMDGAMDIDLTCNAPKQSNGDKQPDTTLVKIASKSSSSAPTPKAAKPTPPPPPKPSGTGLLSSSNLFGGPSDTESSERKGVTIDLHIPLNPKGGNTINIAQEIVRKYGQGAINPRAAEHRARLLQIAAAANKIDGGSNDDMSVDLMSELEGDSNVEMGGTEELTAEGKPRQRRKKVEEYDKEDDFIDDTELAWQEQAAVAKDGFFVYSGPLVPEGESAKVEATSGRGSGRGRGRGRGRGTASTGTTHASLAEKTRDPSAPARARGRGRGTGAPRKPRITKADRERMEMEKAIRERAAGQNSNGVISGPSGAPIAMAPTPQQQHQQYAGQPVGSSTA